MTPWSEEAPPSAPPGYRHLLGMLNGTPLRLRRLVGAIGTEEAAQRPSPPEWSAAEVVLHLAERDRDAFVPRLRRMIAEDTPTFPAEGAGPVGEAILDLGLQLDVFAQARDQAVGLLESLDPAGWRRAGIVPGRGRVAIEAYAAEVIAHDREHLRQLNHVRQALGLRPLRCEAGEPIPMGQLLPALATAAERVERLADDLDARTLRERPGPGEWSMKEVMAHLLKVERDVFLPRLRRIRGEEWPVFERFDPDAWAAECDWREGHFHGELAEFRWAREETVALLRSLGPETLEQVGVSLAFGPVTLHEYATHVAEHDAEHLAQLDATRRRLLGR